MKAASSKGDGGIAPARGGPVVVEVPDDPAPRRNATVVRLFDPVDGTLPPVELTQAQWDTLLAAMRGGVPDGILWRRGSGQHTVGPLIAGGPSLTFNDQSWDSFVMEYRNA